MKIKWAPPAVLLLAAVTYEAQAIQQVKSLYTVIDLDNCKTVATHPDGNEWLCEGLPGYPIYIAEGDLRIYLSAGPKAAENRAAKQTLAPFNTVFEGNSNRTTVEWRYINPQRQPRPLRGHCPLLHVERREAGPSARRDAHNRHRGLSRRLHRRAR